jgi:hypothetical protein
LNYYYFFIQQASLKIKEMEGKLFDYRISLLKMLKCDILYLLNRHTDHCGLIE